MMYERKQQIHEKYLKVPPGWILGTIKRELNLFEHDGTLEDLHDDTIRPWHIRDRIIGNILLTEFRINIIMICYLSLSSQGMNSRLGVRQGRSSGRILCIMRSNANSRRRLRRRRG
jgi:hypothetical protein